jgi:hypothetical protein
MAGLSNASPYGGAWTGQSSVLTYRPLAPGRVTRRRRSCPRIEEGVAAAVAAAQGKGVVLFGRPGPPVQYTRTGERERAERPRAGGTSRPNTAINEFQTRDTSSVSLHRHRVGAAAVAHQHQHGHDRRCAVAPHHADLVKPNQTRHRNGITGRTIAAAIS